MTTELRFLSNEADEDEGLANAGIETFRDDPIAGIARECGQNSLDAVVSPPVTLSFNLLQIPKDEFPARNDFLLTMEACRKRASERKKKDEYAFFTRARNILREASIGVLRISDEGTTGLTGPSKPGTPFHALVKGAGVSEKDQLTAGGSFGIGKHAAYAVSDLRTVFYSTIHLDEDNQEVFLAQGKSILASHVDELGENRRAAGYWGAPEFRPVDDLDEAPAWMRRSVRGTSIFAAGFDEKEYWAPRIVGTLLGNFAVAIHRGTIRFTVDGERYIVDADTLPELFSDEVIVGTAEASPSGAEDFRNSRSLYQCLVSDDSVRFEDDIPGLGRMRLILAIADGLPKQVFFVRNGMLITDNLRHFGDRLSRFIMYRDFIALVEPVDDRANETLKRLEDPKHRDLSPERLIDREEQKKVTKAMKALISWIRENIKQETFDEPEDEEEISELSEFFSDAVEDSPIPDPSSDEADPERHIFTPKPKRPHGTTENTQGEEGGGGTGRGKQKGRNPDGPGRGSGTGGSGSRGRGKPVQYDDFRNTIGSGRQTDTRVLRFTPKRSAIGLLSLEAAGVHENVPIGIVSAKGGIARAGKVIMNIVESERVTLEVTLEAPFEGPVELRIVEISQEEVDDEN